MRLDSTLWRILSSNLSKSTVVRADVSFFNRFISFESSTSHATQNIAHSTDTSSRKVTEVEPSFLYANPICMQLDHLMYKCSNHEELLNLLVSHRGAMYLHNLVTVMKLLRKFVQDEDLDAYKPDCDDLYMGYERVFRRTKGPQNPPLNVRGYTKTEKDLINRAQSEVFKHLNDPRNEEYLRVHNHGRELRDSIIRDERYDLLLQDLYVNKNKLDVASICNVILTLDTLGHSYFRLYNGLLKRLLELDISLSSHPSKFNELGLLLLKTCHCYARAGFYEAPLYNKVSNELFRPNLAPLLQDPQNHDLLSHIIRLYASVKSYDFAVFSKIADTIHLSSLSPADLTWLSVAFSNHLNFHRVHDKVLCFVAERIRDDPSSFTTRQLCTCVSSFSKMRLFFSDVWRLSESRLIGELEESSSGLDDISLEVGELCKALHDIVTVDNSSALAATLVDRASSYLEERIDSLDEPSCINLALSILLTHAGSNRGGFHAPGDLQDGDGTTTLKTTSEGATVPKAFDNTPALNNYLLSFVWRRIGAEVSWESEPLKVFAAWLYHMMVFPHFPHNIHKRCILPCFRQWLLFYFTRQETREEIFEVLDNLSGKFKVYTKFDRLDAKTNADDLEEDLKPFEQLLLSPLPVDLMILDGKFGNKVINVVDSAVRNEPGRPTGVDLVVKGIVEHFGLEFHSVDSHFWRSLDCQGRTRLVESIARNEDFV